MTAAAAPEGVRLKVDRLVLRAAAAAEAALPPAVAAGVPCRVVVAAATPCRVAAVAVLRPAVAAGVPCRVVVAAAAPCRVAEAEVPPAAEVLRLEVAAAPAPAEVAAAVAAPREAREEAGAAGLPAEGREEFQEADRLVGPAARRHLRNRQRAAEEVTAGAAPSRLSHRAGLILVVSGSRLVSFLREAVKAAPWPPPCCGFDRWNYKGRPLLRQRVRRRYLSSARLMTTR
jgi:hypothetical protein